MIADQNTRYLRPGRADRAFNSVMSGLARLGVGIAGSRVLAVRGRRSGEWRTVPVHVLTSGGERYLVAPRGHAQWVRNLRAAGEGELRLGRRVERFTAVEVDDAAKTPVLRAYLRRWGWEVGRFFEGVTADATDAQLADVAPGFPVFRLGVR